MPYELKIPLEVFLILFVGLFSSRYLQAKGLSHWLYRRFSPLMRRFHIPPVFALVFFTSMAAGFAGEALLALAVKEGSVRREDLIPGLMLINFPVFFSFTPLVVAITLPLVGWVGLAYLAVQLSISLVVSLTGALIFWFRGLQESEEGAFVDTGSRTVADIARESFKMSLRVSLVVLVSLTVVHLLFSAGAMDKLKLLLSGIRFRCMGPDIAPIYLAHAFHIAAGAVVAGKLMARGLSPFKVLLGMVWGYVLGVPIRGITNIMPRYCAMYGVRDGVRAWFVVQVYRGAVGVVAALIICGVVC